MTYSNNEGKIEFLWSFIWIIAITMARGRRFWSFRVKTGNLMFKNEFDVAGPLQIL